MSTKFKINRPLWVVWFVGLFYLHTAWASREMDFYQSTRALSMGNAYTAYGAGYDAVFYNPAGLARKNKAQAKLVDIEALASTGMKDVVMTYVTSIGQLDQAINVITENPGTPFGVGFNYLPQFIVKNFSIGLLGRAYYEGLVDADSLDMNFFGFNDLALYTHFATSLFGGIVKLGVGGKAINRSELNQTYTQSEYNAAAFNLAQGWSEGVGYGFDAGILLTAPVTFLPALGVSVTDIGHTDFLERRVLFKGSLGSGAPQALRQKINVGFSLSPKHGRDIRSVFALDFRDVERMTFANYLQHSHIGWELQLTELLAIRMGYRQGKHWTAGASINVVGVILEVASYGEDTFLSNGQVATDRKWVGKYVLEF